MALQFQPYPVLQQTEAQRNALQQQQFNEANQTLMAVPEMMLKMKRDKREQQQFDEMRQALSDINPKSSLGDTESGYTPNKTSLINQPLNQAPQQNMLPSGIPNPFSGQASQQTPQQSNQMPPSMGRLQPSLVQASMNHNWDQYKNAPRPMLAENQQKPNYENMFLTAKSPYMRSAALAGNEAFGPTAQAMAIREQQNKEMFPLDLQSKKSEIEAKQAQARMKSLDQVLAEKVANNEMSIEEAYRQKSAATQTKAPTGFRWTTEGNLISIPGGPADIKSQQEQAAKLVAEQQQKQDAQVVLDKIDTALKQIGYTSAGLGSMTSGIPGSPAHNLQKTIQTIQSNLGFEQLKEMKNQSSRGASGLGQLSDREMQLLTSKVSALDPTQSQDQLRKNLQDVRKRYQGIVDALYSNQSNPSHQMTATNKKTGQRIQSLDGGKTWQPIQ